MKASLESGNRRVGEEIELGKVASVRLDRSPARWLLGTSPTRATVSLAASMGGLLAAVAGITAPIEGLRLFIVMAFSFDLAAGLTSNLSQSTQGFWRSQSFSLKVAYVIVHLTLYPFVLITLVGVSVTLWILLVILTAKIFAFISTFRKR